MKLLKANNYSKALNELEKLELDEDQAKKISEEIKDTDKNHYHIIGVNIESAPGEVKNKVTVNVSKHHPNGFEKLKGSYKYLGINRLIVLHDPTVEEKKPLTVEEKLALKVEGLLKPKATVKAIDEFAVENKIDLGEAGNKEEKQAVIKTWFEEKTKK